MPNCRAQALGLMLLAAGHPWLQGGAPGPGDPLTSLFSALNQILVCGPDPKGPAPTLIMAMPGFAIPDGGLDPTRPDDRVFLDHTLDTIPKPQATYLGSGRTYSGVYQDLLDHAEVQQAVYTPQERTRIAGYRSDLDPAGDQMKAYRIYQKAYDEAVDALHAQVAAQGPGVPPSRVLTDAVATALTAWETKGNLTRLKAEAAAFNTLLNRGAAVWWSDLLDTMTLRAADGTTPLATTYPKPEHWGKGCTWTQFHWSAAGRARAGEDDPGARTLRALLEERPAEGAWTRDLARAAALDGSTVVDVELARVVIYRPWLDENVFTSRAWKYVGSQLPGDAPWVSDGEPPGRNTGIMPLMIEQLWLARKLHLQADWVARGGPALRDAVRAHQSASFGPFSLSADDAHRVKGASNATRIQDNALTADGIQVIAFLCTTVPKCPDFQPSTDPSAQAPRTIGRPER